MSPSSPSPGAAPLPPLPNLSGGGSAPAAGGNQGMASLVSGIAPVKQGVEMIVQGVKMVAQSGVIPGVEQSAGQIIALATSWLPMAAQQLMNPMGGQGGQGGGQGLPPVGAGAGPGGQG